MDGMGWRSRRDWRRTAREWAKHEVAAQDRYDGVARPELERVSQEIEDLEGRQRDLSHQLKVREEWLSSHPEAPHRIEFLDREVARTELAVSPSIADDLTDRLGRHLSDLQGRSLAPDLGLDAGIDLGP